MALLIILAFGSLAAYQVPKLIRAQQKKELVWFCIFFLTGFVLCLMLKRGREDHRPAQADHGFPGQDRPALLEEKRGRGL